MREGAIRVTDLAATLGIAQSSAFRYLWNLQKRGYVALFPDGSYRQGPSLLRLGSSAAQPWQPLIELTRELRLSLRDETEETVNYGVHHGARVLLLEVLSSQQALRMSPEPGTGGYLHSTAMGKAILGCLKEDEAWALLKIDGMPRLTPHTFTTREALFSDLAHAREVGWSVDNEESLKGLRCVAVPIEAPGIVLTALSVEGPISRMSDDNIARYGARLLEVKELVESALGDKGRMKTFDER